MARNRVIGRQNALPWHLPAELAHFKRVTIGHPLIMGRKTHQSIGRPLPGRLNIIVSRNRDFRAPGCTVVGSLDDAYRAAGNVDEVSIIGGTSIFEAALPTADRIHLTEVDADVDGDTWFPEFDRSQWQEEEIERHPPDDRNAYPFRILRLDRVREG